MRLCLSTIIFFLSVSALTPVLSAEAQTHGIDFDGDGISDVTGFENQHDGSANELAITYISSASGTAIRNEYGKSIQSSVPADYDGDGKTDYAIVGVNEVNQLAWQFKLSSGGGVETTNTFGVKDDLVLYGCSFDNDAKADRAVYSASGIITYEKSSDASVGTLATLPEIEKLICADLNNDGKDELIFQKTVKTETASKTKNKRRKKKKPGKSPTKTKEKSFFYVYDLDGTKTLQAEFGSDVKGIFAADTDGDGTKEFGYQREKGDKRTELVFYSGGSEKVYNVPQYLNVNFQKFSLTPGVPEGFVLKAKADNIFLKFASLADVSTYEEFFIVRADTVISNKATSTVGPVVSKETDCNVHEDPIDGGEGFLWKPVSDTTGNVAVLLPSGLRLKKVRIIKDNQVVESLFYGGNGNGNRDHWRSRLRYTAFDENVTVIGTRSGVNHCWLIPDPRKRMD